MEEEKGRGYKKAAFNVLLANYDLTINEVCEKMPITRATLVNWAKNDDYITHKLLKLIAKNKNVPASKVLADYEAIKNTLERIRNNG